MTNLFQVLALFATVHSNAGRDRCAQVDTFTAGEAQPDMAGLPVCNSLSGRVYSGESCETVGPRLDGTLVTICGGAVVLVTEGK